MPEGKENKNAWFNLFYLSAGEICFWLTSDVHLFNKNKERVTLTHRFTFHSSAISRCQSLHCTFQQKQKELLACCLPEGCNPSLQKKRSTRWIYSKGLARLCSLLQHFIFCSSLPPDSSGNWFLRIERDPTQTFQKNGSCVHRRGLIFTCQEEL